MLAKNSINRNLCICQFSVLVWKKTLFTNGVRNDWLFRFRFLWYSEIHASVKFGSWNVSLFSLSRKHRNKMFSLCPWHSRTALNIWLWRTLSEGHLTSYDLSRCTVVFLGFFYRHSLVVFQMSSSLKVALKPPHQDWLWHISLSGCQSWVGLKTRSVEFLTKQHCRSF